MKLAPAGNEITLRGGPRGAGDASGSQALDGAGALGELTNLGEVGGPSPTDGFVGVLEQTALAASAKEKEATEKARALAEGRSDDLHGTMISMKEADISMKLVGTVRDRLLDAFHELWRLNV